MFLVHKDTPGISWNKIDKLGSKFLHSFEVVYSGVRVHKSQIVGEINRGWHAILDTLNNERIFVAAVCVGLGQGAFEDANQYAKERRAYGWLIYASSRPSSSTSPTASRRSSSPG